MDKVTLNNKEQKRPVVLNDALGYGEKDGCAVAGNLFGG